MHNIHLYKNDIPEDLVLTGDLAIDTEAMGLNIHRDRLCVVQISNGNGEAHLVQFDGTNYSAPNLKKLLSHPHTNKIMHFARFDVAIIKHYLGVELKPIYCTKIASKIARTYTDCHGLKDLCRELLGIQISKQQQTTNWGQATLTPEQLQYAANDVLYLHEIKSELDIILAANNRLDLAYQVFNAINVRVDLDLMGWENLDIFAH